MFRACCAGHQTHDQQLLTSLRDSIVNEPPYISGTLQVPASFFSLFYKVAKDGNAARCINLANATPDELKQLAQACKVSDKVSSNMDSKFFASSLDLVRTDVIRIIRGSLLEGEQVTKKIEIEAQRLNIYSKGSSFKPHVDPPRSKKIFGSLVIIFPTHHEGGALFLRNGNHEWIIDPGQTLDRPSIGFLAHLNGTEQGVAPVTSGHCVTLTYNLHLGSSVSVRGPTSTPARSKPPSQDGFHEAFKALLEDSEFMAEGGTLAFGLKHRYPIKDKKTLQHILKILEGSDAVVYQSARALGFEPTVYLYYDEDCSEHEGIITDDPIKLPSGFLDEDGSDEEDLVSIPKYIKAQGGIPVRQNGGDFRRYADYGVFEDDDVYVGEPEPIEWITPITTHNRIEGVYTTHSSGIHTMYGDAFLVVRIGKAGDRLEYPTVAQIKKAWKKSGFIDRNYFYMN